MNISPAAITIIQAHVRDWMPDDAAILADLSTPTIANPTPQDQTLKVLSGITTLGLLSSASQSAVVKLPLASTILEAINGQNRTAVNDFAMALAGAGTITVAEAGAIIGSLSATEPDPSWPAKVSWAQINIGRELDLSDIAASRPEQ